MSTGDYVTQPAIPNTSIKLEGERKSGGEPELSTKTPLAIPAPLPPQNQTAPADDAAENASAPAEPPAKPAPQPKACEILQMLPHSDDGIDGDDDMDPEDFAWYREVYGEVDPDLLKAPDMDLFDEEDGQGYEMDWDEDLDDDVFCEGMMEMAADCGDDAEDEDWIPADVRKRRERREKERKGRLVVHDQDGNITEDARVIIYPGSTGDAWWDHAQLEQVRNAIRIFEKAHPGCQALFIFDQSSAHATLSPDALRAFEMNKSDGGKQRIQHDTVIPMNNPTVHLRGLPQKMTTSTGVQKGLKTVLEERGFNVKGMKAKCKPVCPFESENCCMARLLSQQDDFVNQVSLLEKLITEAGHECMFLPKFHCELNPIEMYWGWCKYRYREIPKDGPFEKSKQAALKCLDACPTEVIRRFVNRSWRFMDAYRKGLSGKAADWAVKTQKGHRSVSEGAMVALEAVAS
ncbi:hypothetical protein MVEN_00030700 [Mycena venus]|uniref:Uncharacterized protein n=1 Tax=Mycena venus TaxID=2733690 RepID=A0A8H7DG02_9AGAR|nr:hypothetical protein MVEN_00030700 [Mycena venus]